MADWDWTSLAVWIMAVAICAFFWYGVLDLTGEMCEQYPKARLHVSN